MGKFLGVIGGVVIAVVLIGIIATIFAFPTVWAVNYLLAPTFLTFMFGTAKIGFWQGLVINFLSGWLFKSTATSSSK